MQRYNFFLILYIFMSKSFQPFSLVRPDPLLLHRTAKKVALHFLHKNISKKHAKNGTFHISKHGPKFQNYGKSISYKFITHGIDTPNSEFPNFRNICFAVYEVKGGYLIYIIYIIIHLIYKIQITSLSLHLACI